MALSPTNPGYLAQCTLTKDLAGRVVQLLRATPRKYQLDVEIVKK